MDDFTRGGAGGVTILGLGNLAISKDFDLRRPVQTVTLTADVTLGGENTIAGKSRASVIRLTASGARILTFAGSITKWLGSKPTALGDGLSAILLLQSFGTAIVASYEEEGLG